MKDYQRIQKIVDLAIDGLLTDGAHHKQWYLEKILIAAGEDLDNIRRMLNFDGYDWDDGIAP